MHPNGQLPAYEWALGDGNPPVHAWGLARSYKIEKKQRRSGDRVFLQPHLSQTMMNSSGGETVRDTEGRNTSSRVGSSVWIKSAVDSTRAYSQRRVSRASRWRAGWAIWTWLKYLPSSGTGGRKIHPRGRRQQVLGHSFISLLPLNHWATTASALGCAGRVLIDRLHTRPMVSHAEDSVRWSADSVVRGGGPLITKVADKLTGFKRRSAVHRETAKTYRECCCNEYYRMASAVCFHRDIPNSSEVPSNHAG